ncbi:hypothetical protein N752_25005 [Desulforamulus aquiferis]|nr:hypothetical protein N752_25005 [Desulforamulus aquiferis]
MSEYKMTQSEARFAELIWRHEPIPSGELVKLCEREFDWKKSTTYTVLKKLCDRGIFQNENAVVSSLIKRKSFTSGRAAVLSRMSSEGLSPNF